MIKGVGTDLVEVARIERSLERFGDKFVKRILAEGEYQAYQQTPSAHFVAKRFAAKEAVAKALGTGMRLGVFFSLIEVIHDAAGKPEIRLHTGAAARADELGVRRWHLSLSDERTHALAFVVAED